MKLIRIGKNVRELHLDNGMRALISYSTPVAMINSDGAYFETEFRWSNSTQIHIRKWWKSLNYPDKYTLAQYELDYLLEGTELHDDIGEWKQCDSQKYPIRDFNRKYKNKG